MATATVKKIEKMFEVLGFSKDYYIGSKLIGTEKLDKPDRKVFGYLGKQTHTATRVIKFKKKKIEIGETYTTELNVLCGKAKMVGMLNNEKL